MRCPNCSCLLPDGSDLCPCGYNFIFRGVPETLASAEYQESVGERRRRGDYIRASGAVLSFWAARTAIFIHEGPRERDFGLLLSGIYFAAIPAISLGAFLAMAWIGKRIASEPLAWTFSVLLGATLGVACRLALG